MKFGIYLISNLRFNIKWNTKVNFNYMEFFIFYI